MEKIRSDRVRDLCLVIQTEYDQQKFMALIQELNHIPGEDDERVGSGSIIKTIKPRKLGRTTGFFARWRIGQV
jgi:hypothetical protein